MIETVERIAEPNQRKTLRRYTYAQLCAELPETNQPC